MQYRLLVDSKAILEPLARLSEQGLQRKRFMPSLQMHGLFGTHIIDSINEMRLEMEDSMTHKRAIRAVTIGIIGLLGNCGALAQSTEELCPRGSYSITKEPRGHLLHASVQLPTLGYKVSLKQGPEKINPPLVRFVCFKPSGITMQVITTYKATLAINGTERLVEDAQGRTQVKFAAASGAMACKANADCKGEREFCDTSPRCGSAASGHCAKRPEICTDEFAPVDGCDGKTYSNACQARSQGVSVKGKAVK